MIFIDDIPTFRHPESITYTFDDRVTKIQLIDGNTVQDVGCFDSGGVFSISSAMFSLENYNRLRVLWRNRTLVTFNDNNGGVWQNRRLVFKSIKRDKNFPNYVFLDFELWGC